MLAVAFAVCCGVARDVGLLGRECCVRSSHPAYAAGTGHVRTRPLSWAWLLFEGLFLGALWLPLPPSLRSLPPPASSLF